MDCIEDELISKLDEFERLYFTINEDDGNKNRLDDNVLPEINDSIISGGDDTQISPIKIPIETTEEDDQDYIATWRILGGEHEADDEIPKCCDWACNKNIPRGLLIKFRNEFQELTKSEQSLVIIGHLAAHRQEISLSEIYNAGYHQNRSRKPGPKLRTDTNYYFRGVSICRKMYFYIHDLGEKRYKNLVKHFDSSGMTDKVHGLFGKAKNRTTDISVDILEKVTTFIKNYAEHHGIPLPGRLPNFKDFRITKLPSSITKAFLYRLYIEAAATKNEQTVGRTSFYDIWQRMCPFITTMKPASDLCDICQEQSMLFGKTKFSSADEIEQKLNAFKEHIKYSKMQREYYKECCKNAATMESTLVLSFDYAQTVNYPSCPQQRGSSYFKAGRKCSIFGIHNEATGVQFNYLIDEEFDVGKGPNSVISMLDNCLAKLPLAKNLILFADNCIGQNKNNSVVNYLAHRVRMNLNEKIEYNFLLSGHTKFSPDRSFGLLKMSFSRSTVDCYDDFVHAVINSSPGGLNQVVNGAEVTFKKYDSYFAQFNKPFKGTKNFFFSAYAKSSNLLMFIVLNVLRNYAKSSFHF